MAKELPYFRFYTDDWLLGKIIELSPAIQGRFVTFCAQYWRRKCDVSLQVYHKFLPKNARKTLESESIIEVKKERVYIKFLDEQYAQLIDSHNKRVKAGSKGGKAKALAMLQAMPENCSSNKEVEVEVDIKEVKEKFSPYVFLMRSEYDTLVKKYGKKRTELMIEKLTNYKESSGKKYKSDYGAINNWVAQEILKQHPIQPKVYHQ